MYNDVYVFIGLTSPTRKRAPTVHRNDYVGGCCACCTHLIASAVGDSNAERCVFAIDRALMDVRRPRPMNDSPSPHDAC